MTSTGNARRNAPGLRRAVSLVGLAMVALIAMGPPATGQEGLKRVALVIGNAAYVNAPELANPRNDARAMAASLRARGFTVEEGIDLDAAGMSRAIRTFGGLAESADMSLVFYAGHGIQVDGINYLLPVDVSLTRERDLNYEGVPLDLIMSEVSQTRRLGVVILDSCRDNPFAQQLQRSMGPSRTTAVGRGLARVDAAPADTLVAFATRAGAVADDGDTVNSPYTTALLAHMDEPGLEIGQYFRKVRDSVLETTNGRQEPFVYGSLSADQFYLNPGLGTVQQVAVSPPVAPSPGAVPRPDDRGLSNETERLFWDSIQDSTDKADFDAYMRQFPRGVFAALARNRIAAIEETERAAAPRPSGTVTTAPERPQVAPQVAMITPPADPGLSAGERRDVQRALQQLGHYGGAIDGLFGPGTRAGIAAFQQSIGVTADGRLNAAQRLRLRQEAALATAPVAETVAATAQADPEPPSSTKAGTEVAILPPPVQAGSFGAIAISRTPNPVRHGACENLESQSAADACALSECGGNCEVRAQFGAGQCGAFVESREWGGGEGFGTGNRSKAIEGAKIGCFRDAGRNYTCELILTACNRR